MTRSLLCAVKFLIIELHILTNIIQIVDVLLFQSTSCIVFFLFCVACAQQLLRPAVSFVMSLSLSVRPRGKHSSRLRYSRKIWCGIFFFVKWPKSAARTVLRSYWHYSVKQHNQGCSDCSSLNFTTLWTFKFRWHLYFETYKIVCQELVRAQI